MNGKPSLSLSPGAQSRFVIAVTAPVTGLALAITLSTKPPASTVTLSTADVFLTTTVYVTGEPTLLSSSVVGSAVFVTSIEEATPVNDTVASSSAVAVSFSSSLTVALTVSFCDAPSLPVNVSWKVQVYVSAPPAVPSLAASDCGTEHVPLPSRFVTTAPIVSVSVVSVTASLLLFQTTTLYSNDPPGSGAVVVFANAPSVPATRTVLSTLTVGGMLSLFVIVQVFVSPLPTTMPVQFSYEAS